MFTLLQACVLFLLLYQLSPRWLAMIAALLWVVAMFGVGALHSHYPATQRWTWLLLRLLHLGGWLLIIAGIPLLLTFPLRPLPTL